MGNDDRQLDATRAGRTELENHYIDELRRRPVGPPSISCAAAR